MGWSFRKSIRITKGVRLNLGKRGIGVSAGIKGFRVGVNSRGTYVSSSIPGIGLYSQQYLSSSKTTNTGGSNAGSATGCLLAIWLFTLVIVSIAAPPLALLGWAVTGVGYWKYRKGASFQNQVAKKQIKNSDFSKAREILESVEKPDLETKYLLGLTDVAQEKYQEAATRFQEMVTTDERYKRVVVLPYVVSLMSLARYADAVPVLQEALAKDEQNVQLLTLLGRCFAAMGKHELAVETYKKGPTKKRNLDEELTELLYQMAVSYEQLGDKANAKRYFGRVYAENASYKDVGSKV